MTMWPYMYVSGQITIDQDSTNIQTWMAIHIIMQILSVCMDPNKFIVLFLTQIYIRLW